MKKIITTVMALALFAPLGHALAYGVDTHAYLTKEAIDLYNSRTPENKIGEHLAPYLIDGSRKEDDAPRWLNHFYDPVYNRGLETEGAIDPAIRTGSHPASRDWAITADFQNAAKYKIKKAIASILTAIEKRSLEELTLETDFTWQRAIRHYARGETEKAIYILGHVVHLVEDASVPDHTRNDPHPPFDEGGSPYESWTGRFNLDNPDDKLAERAKARIFPVFSGISDYFESMAEYSNKNFYSQDTIGIQSGYDLPAPTNFERVGTAYYSVGFDADGEYYLYVKSSRSGGVMFATESAISIDDGIVMQDYWQRLSPRAVAHAAGVIDLFFREAEAAKNDPNFASAEPRSFFGRAIDTTKETIGGAKGAIEDAGEWLANVLYGAPSPRIPEGWTPPAAESSSGEIDLSGSLLNPDSRSDSRKGDEGPNLAEVPPLSASPKPAPVSEPEPDSAEKERETEPTEVEEPARQGEVLGASSEGGGDEPGEPEHQPSLSSGDSGPGAPVIITPSGGGSASSIAPEPAEEAEESGTPPDEESGAQQESEPEQESSSDYAASHPVISEILFNAEGSDKGKEFIELYNPPESALNLADWRLEYIKGDSEDPKTLAVFGGKDEDGTQIPARGFLLAGLNNYSAENRAGRKADIVRSASLPNGSFLGIPQIVSVRLLDAEGNLIDETSYDKESITDSGHSLERYSALATGCAKASGENEFMGNGCAEGLFTERETPLPQNSQNLPEPRPAPQINSFSAEHEPETGDLLFSWDVSGSKFASIYEGGKALVSKSEESEASAKAGLVGTSTTFRLVAEDAEGLASEAQKEINIPGLIDFLRWYKDPRPEKSGYVVDIGYLHRNFIPRYFRDEADSGWQGLVLYLNGSGPDKNGVLFPDDEWSPRHKEGVLDPEGGPNSAALFSVDERFVANAGEIGKLSFLVPYEDNTFRLYIPADEFSEPPDTNDYISPAYYDFLASEGFKNPHLKRAAVDARKYYFSREPELEAPSIPGDVELSFDGFNSRLNVSWATSTDPDSQDARIVYESAISETGEFLPEDWQSHGEYFPDGRANHASYEVAPGVDYVVGVRAKDEFANYSEPEIRKWSFPEGFLPYAKSALYRSAHQDFMVPEETRISSIKLYNGGWDFPVPNVNTILCSVNIYELSGDEPEHLGVNDTPNPGDGSSGSYGVRGPACGGKPEFTFEDAGIVLSPGKLYRWAFSTSYKSGKVRFYGRDAELAGGSFSRGDFKEAAFVLSGPDGEVLSTVE